MCSSLRTTHPFLPRISSLCSNGTLTGDRPSGPRSTTQGGERQQPSRKIIRPLVFFNFLFILMPGAFTCMTVLTTGEKRLTTCHVTSFFTSLCTYHVQPTGANLQGSTSDLPSLSAINSRITPPDNDRLPGRAGGREGGREAKQTHSQHN